MPGMVLGYDTYIMRTLTRQRDNFNTVLTFPQ